MFSRLLKILVITNRLKHGRSGTISISTLSISRWQVLIYRFYNEDTKDCNQYCTIVHLKKLFEPLLAPKRSKKSLRSNMTQINAVLRMRVHQNDHNRIYQKLRLHIFEPQLCPLDQRTFLPSLNFLFFQCQCQIPGRIDPETILELQKTGHIQSISGYFREK